jgi:hypothetical protein
MLYSPSPALKERQRRLIFPSMEAPLSSLLDDPIAQLLLSGEADNPSAAERLYLERHLDQVFDLVRGSLCDEEFRSHPSQLRSRRGFERAEVAGLPAQTANLAQAISLAVHPVTCAYLLPYARRFGVGVPKASLDPTVWDVLGDIAPGSARHLAVVEAVRLAYQRAAKAADQADKRRVRDLQ